MSYTSFADLLAAARRHGSLSRAAIDLECEETGADAAGVVARLSEALSVMEEAIERGLRDELRSRSGLVGGSGRALAGARPHLTDDAFVGALARALAGAEVNACMGRVVAAPTGGASGVLPAVLITAAERLGAPRESVVAALATAGAVGGVIAARATLSGAAGGCQAETGAAAAMAAAATVELAGGTPEQSGHAAAFALQGLLGLVCDPVGGLVEVPCVARNATAVAVSLAAVEMALGGLEFPIPLDEVIDAMGQVGRSLPPSLRETALGGLAAAPTARSLASRLESGYRPERDEGE
ncbi:MAG: L-serine ammonia-lyase, iron-sulfur-dependent, subunit alpha [Anaerosomatales bacterium]|nr:L-serine ammonia-lyase, iron-sulfur-dependent, subunit alpha [Anaerosomatales bacterium]